MPAKKTRRRTTKSLGKKFAENPINTTVNEAKKVGVPKVVTKFAILGSALGFLAPNVSAEADKIPFMSVFTNAGRNLRNRLMNGMKK